MNQATSAQNGTTRLTHVLVVGGKISTNIFRHESSCASGHYLVEDELRPIVDPTPGVGGAGSGSIWVPFACEFERRRLELGFGELLLSIVAHEDYGVGDWVPGGRALKRLLSHLESPRCRPPDFVISQIGERDSVEGTNFYAYVALFSWFYRRAARVLGKETPWVLCPNGPSKQRSPPVLAGQWALVELFPSFSSGPDLSLYTREEWKDGRPTERGAERLARDLVATLARVR